MKTRSAACLALIVALAGCQAAAPALPPGAQALPPAVAPRVPVPPVKNGEKIRRLVSTTWAYGSPNAPQGGSYTQTESIAWSTGAKFGTRTNLYDEHTVTSGGGQQTAIADEYYAFAPLGTALVHYYVGSTGSQGTSSSREVVTGPAETFFEQPLSAGKTWNGAYAYRDTFVQGEAPGYSLTQTTTGSANGDYVSTYAYAKKGSNYTGRVTVDTAGGGSGTFTETDYGQNPFDFEASAPAQNQVPVAWSGGNALGQPPAARQTAQVPLWYAANAPLYSDAWKVIGVAPIPAQCGAPWPGRNGWEVRETYTSVDPAYGTVATQTSTYYYVASEPQDPSTAACAVFDISTTSYYNGNEWLLTTGVNTSGASRLINQATVYSSLVLPVTVAGLPRPRGKAPAFLSACGSGATLGLAAMALRCRSMVTARLRGSLLRP